ncbi:MAG: hypothetical protein JWR60_1598 [Polaromonas sp.]|nr:hypothetical protein [Polaromonas sp.]
MLFESLGALPWEKCIVNYTPQSHKGANYVELTHRKQRRRVALLKGWRHERKPSHEAAQSRMQRATSGWPR